MSVISFAGEHLADYDVSGVIFSDTMDLRCQPGHSAISESEHLHSTATPDAMVTYCYAVAHQQQPDYSSISAVTSVESFEGLASEPIDITTFIQLESAGDGGSSEIAITEQPAILSATPSVDQHFSGSIGPSQTDDVFSGMVYQVSVFDDSTSTIRIPQVEIEGKLYSVDLTTFLSESGEAFFVYDGSTELSYAEEKTEDTAIYVDGLLSIPALEVDSELYETVLKMIDDSSIVFTLDSAKKLDGNTLVLSD
ncbi:MAG: hypothetical protein MI746_06615 [Pseudomonadales bacterium]|nr:hypothetical protein [Pseudomonadales bacterium]